MLFNSVTFLFVFLPIVLLVYYMAAQQQWRWATIWLAFASIVFYGVWNISFVPLLLGSILVNYALGLGIMRLQERPTVANSILGLGIFLNLAALFSFKYMIATFAMFQMPISHHLEHYPAILPLGISFFTFTQLGYLIDCRQGMAEEHNFGRYVLFVSFFPHLIAGPILHHREMMPQFADPKNYRFQWQNLAIGFTMFAIGFMKKVIVADTLAVIAAPGFLHPKDLQAYAAWETALAYAGQLYFDFSGYSDMAIGLARMFGIRFPMNFNSPFKSGSIIEFWQRWHMTLSRYLNLYLYNPIALGIMRRRVARGLKANRRASETLQGFFSLVATPTLITMGLAGIWHGAGWQFFIFGMLHGVYLTINHAWRIFVQRGNKTTDDPVTKIGKVLLTFLAVLVALIFFRSSSAGMAMMMIHDMMGLEGRGVSHVGDEWPICIALAIIFLLPNTQQILSKFEPVLEDIKFYPAAPLAWRPSRLWAIGLAAAFATAIACMVCGGESEFLYFRF